MTTSSDTLLTRAAAALDVDDNVQEAATALYERAEDHRLHRGRPKSTLRAASLYLACKLHKCARSATDIADATEDLSKSEVLDSSRAITSALPIEIPPQSATQYAERYCDDLSLDDETQSIAVKMADTLDDRNGTATGLAASAVYAATRLTDEHVTQSDVSDLTGVSEVTIRNWYSEHLEAYQKTEHTPNAS